MKKQTNFCLKKNAFDKETFKLRKIPRRSWLCKVVVVK